MTIADIAEKSLRRGKGAEQEWAARLSSLLILQIGGDDNISNTLSQILLTTIQNKAHSNSVRAISCTALSMLHFLSTDEIGNIVGTMQIFEQIFSASYLKGDKSIPCVSDDAVQLHVAALGAWGLLSVSI